MTVKEALIAILGQDKVDAYVLTGSSETYMLRSAGVSCFLSGREDEAAGVVRTTLTAILARPHVYAAA